MGTILSSFVLTLLENLKMDNVTIVMNRRQFGYLVKRKGVWDWVLYESCPRTRSRQINIPGSMRMTSVRDESNTDPLDTGHQ